MPFEKPPVRSSVAAGEAHELEDAIELGVAASAGRPASCAWSVEHLACRQPRLVAEQLGQVADPPPRLAVAERPAEHRPVAARRAGEAEQELDGGRLARAVGAEEAERLAALDPEVQGLERDGRCRRPCAGRGSRWRGVMRAFSGGFASGAGAAVTAKVARAGHDAPRMAPDARDPTRRPPPCSSSTAPSATAPPRSTPRGDLDCADCGIHLEIADAHLVCLPLAA